MPQKRLVPDLPKDDFEVLDNDKPQPIIFFDNSIQPITVVVMLDTSGSMTLTLDLLQAGRRAVPDPAAARGQGARRRVQRQDPDSARASPTTAIELVTDVKDLDYGNGTRLWDAIGGEPRRAEADRRAARDSGVHRRRRHRRAKSGWAR